MLRETRGIRKASSCQERRSSSKRNGGGASSDVSVALTLPSVLVQEQVVVVKKRKSKTAALPSRPVNSARVQPLPSRLATDDEKRTQPLPSRLPTEEERKQNLSVLAVTKAVSNRQKRRIQKSPERVNHRLTTLNASHYVADGSRRGSGMDSPKSVVTLPGSHYVVKANGVSGTLRRGRDSSPGKKREVLYYEKKKKTRNKMDDSIITIYGENQEPNRGGFLSCGGGACVAPDETLPTQNTLSTMADGDDNSLMSLSTFEVFFPGEEKHHPHDTPPVMAAVDNVVDRIMATVHTVQVGCMFG